MLWLRRNILFLTMIAFYGCGFQPVYKTGDSSGSSAGLEAVRIGTVTADGFARHAQSLKAYLEDSFNPKNINVSKKYVLSVELKKGRRAQAVEQDREITRYNMEVYATYTLMSSEDEEPVNTGSSTIVSSFDVVESDFATFSAEEDALTRIMKEMSKDLRVRVATFLMNPNKEEMIKKLREKLKDGEAGVNAKPSNIEQDRAIEENINVLGR